MSHNGAEPAIQVETLSKRYRIGLKEEIPDTLVSAMGSFIRRPFANFRNLRRLSHFRKEETEAEDVIWALKEVSFSVEHGEVIGIIGRNGAGKSTLLKILSRITDPTAGQVIINGRVASLLEVGTGFHQELTGRENVYLNGTILGMRKKEVDRKFEEIVAFSGVEKFIDTPVKRYSSGMQVRLAFAVAAHLEPEILIVDEVLAVGDFEFQKKCLGKMQDVSSSGRTVLFVSHNMGAVRQLCNRGVFLHAGGVAFIGHIEETVMTYQASGVAEFAAATGRFERDIQAIPPARQSWVQAVELHDAAGNLCTQFAYGDELRIVFEIGGEEPRAGTTLTWMLYDTGGAPISRAGSVPLYGFALKQGQRRAVCTLKHLPLAIGSYTFAFSAGVMGTREPRDIWREAASFEITACDPYGTGYEQQSHPYGAVVFDQVWSDA